MKRFVLEGGVFDEVARGGGGTAAARTFTTAARGRTLVLLKAIADESGDERAREAFGALARMYDLAPGHVDAVLRYPATGAWALATLRALRAGLPARPQAMAAFPAAVAVRAGLPFETRLVLEPAGAEPFPAGSGRAGPGVMLPSLGRALLDEPAPIDDCAIAVRPDSTVITGRRSRVEVPSPSCHGGPGWQPLRVLSASHPGGTLRLVLDDLDPCRFPPSGAVASRLDDTEVARRRRRLRQAWTILRTHHPGAADEVGSMLTVLTPLVPSAGGPLSGTSRTTFGCAAMAAPEDPLVLAVTLVHEVQHAKLTMLLHLVDLIGPGDDRHYYAPWRRDARPLTGLLHGTYAHLGVAAFWRRQRHVHDSEPAHAEFVRWRDAAAETAQVILDSGALTPLGLRFVTGMTETLRAFQADAVPGRAAELARLAGERHRRGFDALRGLTDQRGGPGLPVDGRGAPR